jgi:hypothetical protein
LDAEAAASEGGMHGRLYASDMAVVMALLFGRVDDEERAAGNPGVGGASEMSAPRSRSGNLTQGHWMA